MHDANLTKKKKSLQYIGKFNFVYGFYENWF